MNRTIAVLILLVSVSASAKIRPAATRPTEEQSEAVKKALHDYNKAMFAGDVKGMVAAQYATTANAKKLAEASAESDAQVAKLETAVKNKWGDEPRKWIASIMDDATDEQAEGGDVQIEGNKARVLFKTGGSASLIKADDHWVIDCDEQTKGAEKLDEFIAGLKKRGDIAQKATAKIEKGKYKDVSVLAGELKQKMEQDQK